MTDMFTATMPAATLKALRGSIAKWEAVAAGTGVDNGPGNCPLCALFFERPNCAGCPVAERPGGEPLCGHTPYDDFDRAARRGSCEHGLRAFDDYTKGLAMAEMTFLVSLLPAGELP